MEVSMFVVVGLGNPGDKYRYTRHNAGFITIDYMASQYKINVNRTKFKAVTGEGEIAGEKVLLVKPQTYMNLSGESVMDIMNWYKLETSKLIVIYDDVDLAVGRLRLRPAGSAGSHNGMKSIIYLLNSDDFPRVRIGIGKQPEYMDLADYVLGRFGDEEIPLMEEAVKNASQAVGEIIKNGINSAMNKYNK